MISRLISQPLADDAFERAISALSVVDAEFDTVRISEIELREIAVKMLFAAVLIDALHAALEDRIVAFDRVGVITRRRQRTYSSRRGSPCHGWRNRRRSSRYCGALSVIIAASRAMLARTIGAMSAMEAIDVEGAGRAAALDKSQDDFLCAQPVALLRNAANSADESFVHFDGFALAAKGREADRRAWPRECGAT